MPAHLHAPPQCMQDYGLPCPTHPRLCAHASCRGAGNLLLCEEVRVGKHVGKYLCGHSGELGHSDAITYEEWLELSSWSQEMQQVQLRMGLRAAPAGGTNDSVDPRLLDPTGRQPKTVEAALQRFRPQTHAEPVGPSFGRTYALIEDFVQRGWAPAFPRIERSAVAITVLRRAKHPDAIEQAMSNLCAPASFMYSLARQDPAAYVKYVTDLYDHGRAYVGPGILIEPRLEFRQLAVPWDTNAADWIALGSLRDSSNRFFAYHRESVEWVRGGSKDSDVEKWFRNFGFREVVPRLDSSTRADLANLKEADSYYRRGYKVCLGVCANFLQASNKEQIEKARNGGPADHIVALASPIILSPHVKFRMYTWNQFMDVPMPLTQDEFLKSYYGFVAARR